LIDREEFEAWKAGKVTAAVLDMLTAMSAEAKAAWIAASWEQGRPDPVLLADLRGRSQTADDVVALTFEDLERHRAAAD